MSRVTDRPLLAVIIPTRLRTESLERAIESALKAAPNSDVEVIVVPNGSDDTWRAVAQKFLARRAVRWLPIKAIGPSVARNHGLANASAEFVRFLDDDDYLYEVGAQLQCQILIETGAHVCSGALQLVTDREAQIRVTRQPATDDFCTAALNPGQHVQVGCHLYRRSVLHGVSWPEGRALYEDVEWMITLACSREISWKTTDEVVAAWVQHNRPRLSKSHDPGAATLRHTAELLIKAGSDLTSAHRLTVPRRTALARGLWGLLQKGLRYEPRYWLHIGRLASSYMPGTRPPSLVHRLPVVRMISPLALEIVLIPLRWAYVPVRIVLDKIGINRV